MATATQQPELNGAGSEEEPSTFFANGVSPRILTFFPTLPASSSTHGSLEPLRSDDSPIPDAPLPAFPKPISIPPSSFVSAARPAEASSHHPSAISPVPISSWAVPRPSPFPSPHKESVPLRYVRQAKRGISLLVSRCARSVVRENQIRHISYQRPRHRESTGMGSPGVRVHRPIKRREILDD